MKRNFRQGVACICLGVIGPSASLYAQQETLSRIDGEIRVDGVVDDVAWTTVTPVSLTMYQPTFGEPPSERTQIRIAHDDAYIYVAGELFDSDPSGIRANSLYRDRYSSDDLIGVVIDPFNDNQNGLWFWVTPAAVRGDASVSDDGGSTNSSWNGHWDAAVSRSEDGWFVEMRIPFSTLGFQAANGVAPMGITVYRFIARKNERIVSPAIEPAWSYLRLSMAQDVVLRGVSVRRPVYVTPYVLSGVGQSPVQTGTQFQLDSETEAEAGLDVQYNLTDRLTLDLTVNTDFAQVEADNQRVNLTRFSLFFPEQRRFFQERAGIFSFPAGGNDRLFHSRRIGLHDGDAIPILGGARLVGRVGPWDVGALSMQTAASGDVVSENFSVLRVRRTMFNENSFAGAMMTARIADDGAYNVAYGLDASVRVAGQHYVTARWAQTVDRDSGGSVAGQFVDAGMMRVTFQRQGQEGLAYLASARRLGPDFRPEMGFVTRLDVTELFGGAWYYHYLREGALRRVDVPQLFGSVILRNPDRTVESAYIEHDFDLQFRTGANIWLDAEVYHENLIDQLGLPEGATVPAGSYWFPRFEGGFDTPPGALLQAGVDVGVSGFYDGWRANLRVRPTWHPSPNLDLSADYQLDVVRLPARDQGFDAHIGRLRIGTAFNA
jgi:hypothetical protein